MIKISKENYIIGFSDFISDCELLDPMRS